MSGEMYKVSVVTRQERLKDFQDALNEIGVIAYTVSAVEGFGTQLSFTETYRGVKQEIHLLPKVLVEIVVSTVPVDDIIEVAKAQLRTEEPGDGKIFVSKVTKVVRIRTGELDYAALTNDAK
ncbi:MAG: P-II family nitrogen regulator [Clostridiales Family XIII bacterium]|jgi:nitrogen regulatory protein PII|nr:P-II family nitrogen regulator [Clostridiales Family XIII bacterium]